MSQPLLIFPQYLEVSKHTDMSGGQLLFHLISRLYEFSTRVARTAQ
jgi:hypothetical protein